MNLQVIVDAARGYAPKRNACDLSASELAAIAEKLKDKHISPALIATAYRVDKAVIRAIRGGRHDCYQCV